MLIEEKPATEQSRTERRTERRAERSPGTERSPRGLTWELDELSVARQVAAYVALAGTVSIAVALLLGA